MNFKSLISENNRDISMGRISFWILLIMLIYFWIGKSIFIYIFGIEMSDLAERLFTLPEGLLAAWLTSLAYNAYKKLPVATENEKVEDIKTEVINKEEKV